MPGSPQAMLRMPYPLLFPNRTFNNLREAYETMPPDKNWRGEATMYDHVAEREFLPISKLAATTESMECVLQQQQRVLTDFSYIEQPMRCLLTSCQGTHLAFNGNSAFFLTDASMEEFTLHPQVDGSVVIQHSKSSRYLCSNPTSGTIYASREPLDDAEKWVLTKSTNQGMFVVSSFARPDRHLASSGKLLHMTDGNHNDQDEILWKVDFTFGELCFLTLSAMQMRVRCDLVGNLSLSKNYKGWEAWRLAEAGNGHVRITPWAHADLYLSSDDQGNVCTTKDRGDSETWTVTRAPNGLDGVIVKSAKSGRVLGYDKERASLCTHTDNPLSLDESCVWDFESLHRQTYYLATSNDNKKLEAAKKGLGTRGLPGRMASEEWIIQPTNEYGVVTMFSNARQRYLASNELGNVFMLEESKLDGSEKWVMEERDGCFVVFSQATQRVLVVPDKGSVSTVEPGTIVKGCARWKLEPKLPRQVNREKIGAIGAAVAIGVVGTVATPFVIGGAIGIMGVAQVGVAGQVAIGSIRAVEALNTITRVSLSSSQLIVRQSSCLSTESTKSELKSEMILNRPFCAWRSW